jgi:hypothetical protein
MKTKRITAIGQTGTTNIAIITTTTWTLMKIAITAPALVQLN